MNMSKMRLQIKKMNFKLFFILSEAKCFTISILNRMFFCNNLYLGLCIAVTKLQKII